MKGRQKKRQKFKRTTISLPYDLWESLRIESIKRNISMGEANSQKVKGVGGAKAKDRHNASGREGTSQAS